MSALPILLVVASLAFLILEVFVVSFGALTIVAIACGILGVVLAFGQNAVFGWVLVGTLVAGAPLCIWGAFKVLPKLPFARGFYLDAPKLSKRDRAAAAPEHRELLGAVGTAISPLRPSGTARFGDEPIQVLTRGLPVPPGSKVRVVDVSGNRIVVEPIEEEE